MAKLTERAEEIFCAVLALGDPIARASLIERSCAGEGDLRAAVDEMLASHEEAGRLFEDARTALAWYDVRGEEADGLCDDEERAARIGHYKLLSRIGEGGWGVVYLALQEYPFCREVALKIIKLGMDTRAVIARFEAERQALAMMDHPYIAKVFDAGATDTGRPYFVMEVVKGRRITRFCRENELKTRERLTLFVKICQAIQHAHQKGIIHRDIKPSNILISPAEPGSSGCVPKIIDFGIAKAATEAGPERWITGNGQGQPIGTPAYMSPEQVASNGVDVDTRSDVYSLGVLLYELLTGRPLVGQSELEQASPEEVRRILLEREPLPPSAALAELSAEELRETARERRTDPDQLISKLRGDLDWIVMKALEKERSRRYETANALACDIQRYLDHEPVAARPPSRLYRLRKLIRRNRGVFIAGSMVMAAILAGFGTSTWLFFRERAARYEQIQLRQSAEIARANERRLRREAEIRETITEAALKINRDNFAAADRLVASLPVGGAPSYEAVGVFRTLGVWHALDGNWPRAADCFMTLVHVNQVDASDMTDRATRDLLAAGPAIAAAGDAATYEKFVQFNVRRFARTENPIAAEQVLKASLVKPIAPDILDSLQPFADLTAGSFGDDQPSNSRDPYMLAWRAFALGLMEFRLGNVQQSFEWMEQCLAYRDTTPTRIAMARLLLAGNFIRMEELKSAREEIDQARKIIAPHLTLASGYGSPSTGFWHDWLMARILLNEMETLWEARNSNGLVVEF